LQNLLLTLYYIIFHSGLTDWSLSYGFWGCGCSEYWDYWTFWMAVTSRGMVDGYWRFEG
jgi:hypothetical protein